MLDFDLSFDAWCDFRQVEEFDAYDEHMDMDLSTAIGMDMISRQYSPTVSNVANCIALHFDHF